ncbi:MAG TPA: hypothetical protein VGO47_02470 [Chlamydiales bacterium]|nr:hypothetical protein [Chlamydiales bacterium]
MFATAEKFVARLQELHGEVKDKFLAIVYFDEAHTLQEWRDQSVRNSYFSLLSALNALCELPILFVFLSTNSGLHVFAPQNAVFPSLRVQGGLRLIPPYFELPYDTFAAGITHKEQEAGRLTLSSVCKLEQVTRIGRPL